MTGNFTLTVRMMTDMIKANKIDCYMLIANTGGVNVWCAAGGGHFSHKEILAAIKTSEIAEFTKQRTLILPRLAASGVNIREIKRKSGFRSKFGPVRLEDIPEYLREGDKNITEPMKRIRFNLRDKLEMGVGAGLWPAVLFGLPALFGGLETSLKVMAISYILTVVYTVAAG